MKEVSTLYECRHCGGLATSSQNSCPYCGTKHVGEKEVGKLEGGTKTVKQSWYRRVEIVPERVRD